jgi:hypothetical protein
MTISDTEEHTDDNPKCPKRLKNDQSGKTRKTPIGIQYGSNTKRFESNRENIIVYYLQVDITWR